MIVTNFRKVSIINAYYSPFHTIMASEMASVTSHPLTTSNSYTVAILNKRHHSVGLCIKYKVTYWSWNLVSRRSDEKQGMLTTFLLKNHLGNPHMKVGWKVHGLSKILSQNVTKWGSFFSIIFHWWCDTWISKVKKVIYHRYEVSI